MMSMDWSMSYYYNNYRTSETQNVSNIKNYEPTNYWILKGLGNQKPKTLF